MFDKMIARASVFSALVLVGVHLRGDDLTRLSYQEVFAHRLPRVDWIRTPGADEAALTVAKTWKYKPSEQDGKPQAVTFNDFISLLLPERPARLDVPFPTVRNWANVKITLKRTRCLGTCPAYQVQISGNGEVLFQGVYPREDEQHGHVSREQLKKLLDVFRTAHFDGLERKYITHVTDLPYYFISISIDGQSAMVVDYGGLQVGMPTQVRDVENMIDEIAGTSQWLPSGQSH